MKTIFTWPNNSGTSFIDPNYVGDDTVGFQKRIKELVDGTYKPWDGTIPSDTVTNIMSELSKFNDAPWFETQGNNSIFDFWYNPLYTGTVELISSDISSATATHTVTSNIEFSGNHGFYDTQYLTLSGFDGSYSALNGNDYYVKKIDADTIQLCTDVDLTLPLEFYDVENATLSDALINAGGNVDFNIDTALHNDLSINQQVVLSNFGGTMAEHNGDNFYVKNLTANDFNLSYDAAGNNMLGYPTAATNQAMSFISLGSYSSGSIGAGSGPIYIKLPLPSGANLPFGSRVYFNENDSTTHGPQGEWSPNVWQGPSSMLAIAASGSLGYLFLKPVVASNGEYHLYYDALCTVPVESLISIQPWSLTGPTTGQAGQLTVVTPVSLERINDVYTFKMRYSNVVGDLSGYNLTQICNLDMNEEWEGFKPFTGTGSIQAFGKKVSGQTEFYNPYIDQALTKPANLGYHILNAGKIVYTAQNTKLFLKGNLDDQGNLLTNKDLILNEDTLVSLTDTLGYTRDQVLDILNSRLTNDWTMRGQTSYTNGILYPGYASITGQTTTGGANLPEQTLDSKAIIKISSSATNQTIEADWNTSSYTEHKTALEALNSSSSWTFRTWEYNKTTNSSEWSTVSGDFFTELENRYNADPTTVIGRPFVFGWDYNVSTGADSGTEATGSVSSVTPKTAYMLPIGYKTWTDSVTGDSMAAFNIQSYLIDTHADNYGEIGANSLGYSTVASTPFSGYGMFGNYQHQPNQKVIKTYLQDTFVSSRTDHCDEISFTITSGFVDQPFSTIPITSKLRTGDLVQVKTKNLTTGEVVDLGEYIANMYADYSNPDANGNFIGNLQFFDTDGLGGWGNYDHLYDHLPGVTIGLPAPSSANNFHVIVETRYESILSDTGTMPGGLLTPAVDNNIFMHDTLYKSLYIDNEIYSNQIGTQHTQLTTYDIGYVYTDSTTGDVQEVYTPPTPNIIATGQDVDSTTGTLTISTANYPGTAFPQQKYRLASVSQHMYGNKTYMQRTGASTYVNNARLKPTSAWSAGDDYQQIIDHFPVTTLSTDSSGYLTSGFTFDSEFPGQFNSDRDIAFEVEKMPDTYTPPALSPAAAEDVFDTDDEWADYGYAGGLKEWPAHVTPSKADIVYNAPTIANMSQSGIKYTRSVGHTDWRLDVAYPPMTHSEFQKFHAIAQAAQGQAMPFHFKLHGKNNEPILWKKFEDTSVGTTQPRFKNAVASGDRLALLEGFQSNESNAFLQGEVFIDGNNDNGYVHTVLNTVDANVYGEAKIRTPWPFRTPVNPGDGCYKEPSHIVVTLANDNFEYKVDTAGYYYMSVSFDLDDWK